MTLRVCIYGFGYVGATLAAVLVDEGMELTAIDVDEAKIKYFEDNRKLNFYEPDLDKILSDGFGKNFFLKTSAEPGVFDVAVISVSTPVNPNTHEPNLDYIGDAFKNATETLKKDGLLIIRSTCPVGTTKKLTEKFKSQLDEKSISVAFCPERTIQGQALREIRELPQVVGAENPRDRESAKKFWSKVASEVVLVTSTESAELVKLVNNCHTDVIYGYGNQVALVAQHFGIDAEEVIGAANLNYPRPNLHRPGYVGGACLIKDPYILLSSVPSEISEHLSIIRGARQSNEAFPGLIAGKIIDWLADQTTGQSSAKLPDHSQASSFVQSPAQSNKDMKNKKILFCGVAYKGVPATDDLRGAHIFDFIDAFKKAGSSELYSHDFVVTSETMKDLGLHPMNEDEIGNSEWDAVIFLNNHPDYLNWKIENLFSNPSPRGKTLVFDSWSLFKERDFSSKSHLKYLGLSFS